MCLLYQPKETGASSTQLDPQTSNPGWFLRPVQRFRLGTEPSRCRATIFFCKPTSVLLDRISHLKLYLSQGQSVQREKTIELTVFLMLQEEITTKRKHGVSLTRISVMRELTKGHITPLSGSDRGESVGESAKSVCGPLCPSPPPPTTATTATATTATAASVTAEAPRRAPPPPPPGHCEPPPITPSITPS